MRRWLAGRHAEAVYERIFARMYDPSLWLGEVAGMRRKRRELLLNARGRVLEIGAGTGLNVPFYPEGIELIVAEPDRAMAARLARRAGDATVIDAPAESLPLEDDSVDTVVSTLVLCTVADPRAALLEIRRVLRPGGELLLIEHVRSEVRWRAAVQRLLRKPWSRFARGCRCDQATVELLHAEGFRTELDDASWRTMPVVVGPLVVGRATPA
jgi:ubiquinone/menaquinone biosynthesis C-methylase UbiE